VNLILETLTQFLYNILIDGADNEKIGDCTSPFSSCNEMLRWATPPVFEL